MKKDFNIHRISLEPEALKRLYRYKFMVCTVNKNILISLKLYFCKLYFPLLVCLIVRIICNIDYSD